MLPPLGPQAFLKDQTRDGQPSGKKDWTQKHRLPPASLPHLIPQGAHPDRDFFRMRNISRFSGCNLDLLYIALILVSFIKFHTPVGFDSMNSYVTKCNTTLFPDSGRKLKSWVLAMFWTEKSNCQINLDAKIKFIYSSSEKRGCETTNLLISLKHKVSPNSGPTWAATPNHSQTKIPILHSTPATLASLLFPDIHACMAQGLCSAVPAS